MTRDPVTSSESVVDDAVMAAIDTDGGVPRLVIADITSDGTWLSIPADTAASLSEWR